MPSPRFLRATLILALVGAAACSDDGGDEGSSSGDELSSEEQAFADAWATTLVEEDDGFAVPQDDADCMATAIVVELGTEPFEEAELEPADIEDASDSPGELLGAGTITDKQADAILAAWEGCTDLGMMFAEGMGEEMDIDDEAKACLAKGVNEEGLALEGLRPSFTSESSDPSTEVLTAITGLVQECAGSDGGGPLVDSIAESLAADGSITEEQAQCVAQAMIDEIGVDRLIELGVDDGAQVDPTTQQEMMTSVLAAAESCGVDLEAMGG